MPAYWRYRARSEVIGCIAGIIFLPMFLCLVAAPLAARSYDSTLSIWYLIIPLVIFAFILFVGLPLLVILIRYLRSR